MCTKNHNNMRYSSCDKGREFLVILVLLPHLYTTQKIKILKKWNTWRYRFTQVHQRSWSYAIYTVPKIWHVMDVYNYFPFSAILCNFIPLRAPKNKIFKKLKKQLAMFIKIMIRWCTVPEILSEQTVTKWHIEVRALFKKINVKLWRKQKNEDYKAKDKIRRVKVAIFNF